MARIFATRSRLLPITLLLGLAGLPIANRTEARMTRITSQEYRCSEGQGLNLQRWWTEPIADNSRAGRYFLCGGNSPAASGAGVGSDRCDVVDVASCRVEVLNTLMSTARQSLQPVCLSDGRCYLFGGNTREANPVTTSVDLLEMATGRIRKGTTTLPDPRLAYAATALDDETILITGGYGVKDPETQKGVVSNTALRFRPGDGTHQVIPMVQRRGGHSLTRLSDGRYLLVGGNGDDPLGAEIFDPKTGRFDAVKGKMAAARKDHRAVLAKDGKVYILGGTFGPASPVVVEVFDPETGLFSDTGLWLSEGREDPAVVYLRDFDAIVAVGGEVKGKTGEPESRRIDVIDLKRRRVVSGELSTPRDEPSLVVQSIDRRKRTARLLILTGQQKRDGTEVSLPVERVIVSF